MSDMRRGYFFDLDGTFVDTHESNTAAYSRAIAEVLPDEVVDRGELRRRIANGEHCADFLRALVPGITDEQVHLVAAAKKRLYPEEIPRSTLNQELVEKARSWKDDPGSVLVLVTTAKRANAEHVLGFHGISDLFDLCVFGDDVERLKPDPEIYLRALDASGLEASQVLAFEDSGSGLAAARAAGIEVVHVTWAML